MKNILGTVGLLSLLTACFPVRTVLIRNYTAQPVTLVFPKQPNAGFLPGTPATLRFAAAGTQRDSVLRYGTGPWTTGDQAQLRRVLEQSRLVVGADTLPLPPHFQLVSTYRVLVKEFYVKLTGPVPAPTGAPLPR